MGAHQKRRTGPVISENSQLSRVLLFIERNQDCTVADIVARTGIKLGSVKKEVQRLRERGKVARVRLHGHAFLRWRIGCEDTAAPKTLRDSPRQRIVSDWMPCTVRDPLIDLLFGRNV